MTPRGRPRVELIATEGEMIHLGTARTRQYRGVRALLGAAATGLLTLWRALPLGRPHLLPALIVGSAWRHGIAALRPRWRGPRRDKRCTPARDATTPAGLGAFTSAPPEYRIARRVRRRARASRRNPRYLLVTSPRPGMSCSGDGRDIALPRLGTMNSQIASAGIVTPTPSLGASLGRRETRAGRDSPDAAGGACDERDSTAGGLSVRALGR